MADWWNLTHLKAATRSPKPKQRANSLGESSLRPLRQDLNMALIEWRRSMEKVSAKKEDLLCRPLLLTERIINKNLKKPTLPRRLSNLLKSILTSTLMMLLHKKNQLLPSTLMRFSQEDHPTSHLRKSWSKLTFSISTTCSHKCSQVCSNQATQMTYLAFPCHSKPSPTSANHKSHSKYLA